MAGELATTQRYTADQVDLIRRTVTSGDVTDDELALFVAVCKRTNLDPFARQIHAIKRGGKLTIQTGIDGLRLIAQRTGEADGMDGPYWCGPGGEWVDVWLATDRPPVACKVAVYRRGQSRGYTAVARYDEYQQPSNALWKKMPAAMLAKATEALALRKAFPAECSGLYADEETHQADADGQPPAPRAQQAALPAKPPASPPAWAQAADALAECESLDDLQAVWRQVYADRNIFSADQWDQLTAAKERRKAELAAAGRPTAPPPPKPPAPPEPASADALDEVRGLLDDLRELADPDDFERQVVLFGVGTEADIRGLTALEARGKVAVLRDWKLMLEKARHKAAAA